MTKVITYGTYDLLHYGHIRLLERAKALGDYLIVGVTSDDYDKTRGKINNKQSLMERVAAIRATGIADEVIAEEYDGQKIDDIRKYGVDIFAIGSDWIGKFDYLGEYCKVIYLPRTEGISSSEIRAKQSHIRLGLIGEAGSELTSIDKFVRELKYVNGAEAICANVKNEGIAFEEDFDAVMDSSDALYIASHPTKHYDQIKKALINGTHVLCETPISLSKEECSELFELAEAHNCILMEGAKTAYTTAFERLVLLAKTGKIGEIVSVDATCTSQKNLKSYKENEINNNWNTITEWGPLTLLAVFQVLGCDYKDIRIETKLLPETKDFDIFTRVSFIYDKAVASIKVAKGAKSEGELVITGTEGYIYVPAPWWKTDYFEIRYENQSDNKRYFYQLEGEGIRYEIVAFVKAIENGNGSFYIGQDVSKAIAGVMEEYYKGKKVLLI
ncbi:adenylyltransferase/cytidyltransferase family protein [Sporofaciens sp. JLR.KK001]|uniref:adenylyltransferase/cytidyltransferase family protein n=1 Tax=Sporofaciens sp. JLR.KK001 TaxID=3112621 RepID=UPI002FF433C7